ncbi:MAG: DMT family transporter [Hyphomonadaceae bacterium]|nr:DMT family transporter [Hyphomonadaceae bacterium]
MMKGIAGRPLGERTRATLAVAGGAAIIGLAPVGMRLSELGPMATGFWRFAFALPVLWAVSRALAAPAPTRNDGRLMVVAGLLFAMDLLLWHAALGYTTVANATLFSNMTPVIAAAAGWLLFKERLGAPWFVGAALAVLGAVAMSYGRAQQGQGALIGDLLGIASMVWYAAYLVMMRGVRDRVTASTAMLVTTAAAMAGAAVATVVMGEPFLPAQNTWAAWGVLIFLGVFVHSCGQGFIAYGLGKLPIALSTILLFVQPVAAAAFGWVLFDEPLGAVGLGGAALILVGVFIVQRGRQGASSGTHTPS